MLYILVQYQVNQLGSIVQKKKYNVHQKNQLGSIVLKVLETMFYLLQSCYSCDTTHKSQSTSIREKEAFESMRQTLRRATRRRPESFLSRLKSKGWRVGEKIGKGAKKSKKTDSRRVAV
jgi:hypothetical protein